MRGWHAAFLVVASVWLGACGGGTDVRPTPSVVPTAVESPSDAPEAAARWEELASLGGSGPTSEPLTIADQAVQWRVRWRCWSGRLRLSVEGSPEEALADGACPGRGLDYSIHTGPVRLLVDASSRWRVTVEQQVHTALHEPPLRGMVEGGHRVVGRGSFYSLERSASGTAILYAMANGRLALRLEEFETLPTAGLFLWISTVDRPRTTAQLFRRPRLELTRLRATAGDQNYLLPRETQARSLGSVVIWCAPVRIAYAAASLGR